MRIAAVGDNCIDEYFRTNQLYPGGNAVNVSVYVARMGYRASYVGVVGDDPNGELIRRALERKGVDLSHLHTSPGKTAVTKVELRDGERVFRGYDEGVLAGFRLTEDDLSFLQEHDLVATALWGRIEKDLPRLKQRGIPTAFDFGDKYGSAVVDVAIPWVDYAFFSAEGLREGEIEPFLKEMKARGPKIVTVTQGERGSTAFDGGKFVRCGIVPCDVVDTMGAGDSFIAGFLVSLLEGKPLKECMEKGAQSSSMTLQYFGAWEP